MSAKFSRLAHAAAQFCGTWQAFALACMVVMLWLVAGLFVGYGNTLYQLAINTGTTIVTFLMVFLLQNTQNRDNAAMNVKLDELIRCTATARNQLVSIEEQTEADIGAAKAKIIESVTVKHGGR